MRYVFHVLLGALSATATPNVLPKVNQNRLAPTDRPGMLDSGDHSCFNRARVIVSTFDSLCVMEVYKHIKDDFS